MYSQQSVFKITVPGGMVWDEINERFWKIETTTLELCHNLVSISKWEMKWKIAYLKPGRLKTSEELFDYIRCMTVNTVDSKIYSLLTRDNIEKISRYLDDPMTATVVNTFSTDMSNDVMTSEYIYFLMFTNGIPIECELWPINRLIVLLKIYSIKLGDNSNSNKKIPLDDVYARNRMINAQNRARFNSKG